ncbi:MAG TPA: hypothetical protein PLO37_15590 [Candidatus Hydrogenedentes bacterium]|nr:hypothetical protein [Candidatus Hydrogenedentota bacterium]HPG68269.1 hypothetical protein [Candidatus Hydrogenedentota bacterium]
MAGKSYRPSNEERESAKERMAEAKTNGISFDDCFNELLEELPELKKATAYTWWQSVQTSGKGTGKAKTEKKTEPVKTNVKANPSDELATLLRKEGMLQNKLVHARAELKAVQADIQRLWKTREKEISDALKKA